MANTEYKRMQQRQDTSANWTALNPVLASGEIGYDITAKKFKLGDGVSDWSTLDYYESGSSTVTAGDGIDITGGRISTYARSAQFAYDLDGEMYLITSGDGGFVTNKVMKDEIERYLGTVLVELADI